MWTEKIWDSVERLIPVAYIAVRLFIVASVFEIWWEFGIAIRAGFVFSAAGVPIFMLFIFVVLAFLDEGYVQRLKVLFNPRKQSWAFLCDPLLVVAFGITALAWRSPHLHAGHWYDRPRWYAIAAPLIGLGLTVVFWVVDHPRYRRDNPTALKSPTKIWHDYAIYPMFLSVAVATMAPLLWVRTWHTWVVLACVLVWAAAGVADMFRDLDARVQHVAWDSVNYRSANS